MIECTSPKAQYLAAKSEIDEAVRRVMEGGWYILGKEVREFEQEFAQYIGVRHGVGVGNGTDAIHLALRALDVGPGSEVITVSHTAVATVAAIELAGATPVFVDIDPVSFTIDTTRLAAAITTRTRAVIAVHLYGHPVDLTSLAALCDQHGIALIEDCAQAHGAKYKQRRVGSFGQVACFSFYPTKNLGALGDGGMVVASDDALASRLRELREYGWRERYISSTSGMNTRLDELQAAVLRVKLRRLDAANAARRERAVIYDRLLEGSRVVRPQVARDIEHAFHLYVVRVANRDAVRERARERGVATLIHYPVPIHLQPAYRGRVAGGDLAETERAASEVLSLPMFPELDLADTKRAAETIAELVGR